MPIPSGQPFFSRCPGEGGNTLGHCCLSFPPFSPSQTRGFRRDSWRWGRISGVHPGGTGTIRGWLPDGPAASSRSTSKVRALLPSAPRPAPDGGGEGQSPLPLSLGESPARAAPARPLSPGCSHPRGFSAALLSFPEDIFLFLSASVLTRFRVVGILTVHHIY